MGTPTLNREQLELVYEAQVKITDILGLYDRTDPVKIFSLLVGASNNLKRVAIEMNVANRNCGIGEGGLR